jgi:hypothetical protein
MSSQSTSSQTRLYGGWRRDRFGWFMGLSGGQLLLVALCLVPPMLALSRSRWAATAELVPLSAAGIVLIAVPVHGRPAARWLADLTLFLIGRAMGWSMWRSQAATGAATPDQLRQLDLPGVLARLRMHDGPPQGPLLKRVCVIQDAHRWSATARCTHPGLGAADQAVRDGYADQLGSMLAATARSGGIARVSILVRTVPDDGAERAAWVADHQVTTAPEVVRLATAQIEASVMAGAVRHEVFVTVGVDETAALRRAAREAGGGVTGRARVLARHLQEVEQRLRAMGCTQVTWLDSEEMAAAIRTGYSPAAAGVIEAARQQAARGRSTMTGTLPGAAGPTIAPLPAARVYTHDAYATVSYALLLPDLPTQVGALARALIPSTPGERRCLALHYEPLDPEKSAKKVQKEVWATHMAETEKERRGFRVDQAQKRRHAETLAAENQIAAGHTMVRIAGAAAITVPADWSVNDHAARLEADARACQYELRRLDLAQDVGMVAACLPLGVGLPGRGDR